MRQFSLILLPILVSCAGADGSGSALQPDQQAAAAGLRQASERVDVRFGIDDSALRRRSALRGPGSYPPAAANEPTLFVSDIQNNVIAMYPIKGGKNPKQIGTITQGVNFPAGLAFDNRGTLYVANNFDDDVLEYPRGSTSPSVVLKNSELSEPNGIAIDRGTLYVTSCLSNCSGTGQTPSLGVLEFAHGSQAPTGQITGFPCGNTNYGYICMILGLAFDKQHNLYVAGGFVNKVFEVPHGTTTPQDMQLSGLGDPTDVAVDAAGNLWVVNNDNFGPSYPVTKQVFTVVAFHPGQTTPYFTMTEHPYVFTAPYAITFEKQNRMLFVSMSDDTAGDVKAFRRKKNGKVSLTPRKVFSQGLGVADGVAVTP